MQKVLKVSHQCKAKSICPCNFYFLSIYITKYKSLVFIPNEIVA